MSTPKSPLELAREARARARGEKLAGWDGDAAELNALADAIEKQAAWLREAREFVAIAYDCLGECEKKCRAKPYEDGPSEWLVCNDHTPNPAEWCDYCRALAFLAEVPNE